MRKEFTVASFSTRLDPSSQTSHAIIGRRQSDINWECFSRNISRRLFARNANVKVATSLIGLWPVTAARGRMRGEWNISKSLTLELLFIMSVDALSWWLSFLDVASHVAVGFWGKWPVYSRVTRSSEWLKWCTQKSHLYLHSVHLPH
jgi:hypothetical protein